MVAALFDMPSHDPEHDWPHHGTMTGYSYGCRCELCRQAKQDARRRHQRNAFRPIICARCGEPYFRASQPNAGTKYCGPCRESGAAYTYTQFKRTVTVFKVLPDVQCQLCGVVYQGKAGTRFLDACTDCRSLLPDHIWHQMKTHHADMGWVRRFLNDPRCQICGAELLDRIKHDKGKYRSRLSIDHDHNCCARQVSCGKCIRGFLCHRHNVAIGFLGDDIDTARAALAYLERVSGRDAE